MVIVRIIGGLGNQMFQYAYAKALQKQGYAVKIDISKFNTYKLHGGYQLHEYNIDLETSSTLDNLLTKFRSVKEKSLLFNDDLLKLPKKAYVKGYFQTENYFKDIRKTLEKQFTLKNPLSVTTKNYKEAIEKVENSCSIHIRRGDFVSNSSANKVHGTCDISYYKDAVEFLTSQYKNIHFFVFSDDINWSQENLEVSNATYISHKTIPHEDLYLMSLCRFNVTANSSFSWWAAWLNQHKNKVVISPKKWFVDKENEVACTNWIKL